MKIWTAIIIIAIVIETIAELCKQWFPLLARKEWAVRLATIALGVLVAFAYNADLFAALDMTARIPFIGVCLTGVLTAGGSNIIFDIVKRIQGAKATLEASLPLADDETSVAEHEDNGNG